MVFGLFRVASHTLFRGHPVLSVKIWLNSIADLEKLTTKLLTGEVTNVQILRGGIAKFNAANCCRCPPQRDLLRLACSQSAPSSRSIALGIACGLNLWMIIAAERWHEPRGLEALMLCIRRAAQIQRGSSEFAKPPNRPQPLSPSAPQPLNHPPQATPITPMASMFSSSPQASIGNGGDTASHLPGLSYVRPYQRTRPQA
jgi:hypothetical protein